MKQLEPPFTITPYHANIITDPRFTLDWFKSFDFVMNALDNLEARRHVNKMCLAAGKPLIESGTAGLLGQASLHMKVSSVDSED
jgi:ubiquitin-like 1-activating enzyme E1 B